MATISITTDFNGKIVGSTSENPNICRNTYYNLASPRHTSSDLRLPSEIGELEYQFRYDYLMARESGTLMSIAGTDTRAQTVYSFDVIRAVEKALGADVWGKNLTLEQKITKARQRIKKCSILISGLGYYSTATQNFIYQRYITALKNDNVWDANASGDKVYATADLIHSVEDVGEYIDSNGYIHFNYYTEIDTKASTGNDSTIWSEYVSCTIDYEEFILPMTPTDFTGAGSLGKVTLQWTPVANASSYDIFRSVQSGTGFELIANTVDSTYEDIMENNLDETTYFYKITASNQLGSSEPTGEIAIAPLPLYKIDNIFIHPSLWNGDLLTLEAVNYLIENYNQVGKKQEIYTQKPMVTVMTYN